MSRWTTSPSGGGRPSPRPHGPSTYDDCLRCIRDKKSALQSARYPANRRRLEEALDSHRQTSAQVDDLRQDIDRVLGRTYDEGKKKALEEEYAELKVVSDKKLGCISTMLDITALEENCGTLSHEMDMKAAGLVDVENRGKTPPGGGTVSGHIRGFLSPGAKDCIFGVQDNWDWIVKLVKCVDIHLKNGSHYHQFFHEVDETEELLQDDLDRLQSLFEDKNLSGKDEDATKLLKEIEEISVALRQWESRVDGLWEKGTKVVPVHLRTGGVSSPTPARALTDYDTDQLRIREGEDLLLLDNSDSHVWRVRNCNGEEGEVPALTVLIPGPYKEAVDAAVKMRLKLLATWTNAIKRLGKRLITYMLLIFKPEYDEDEIKKLRQVRKLDKQELVRILDVVEDTLKRHWSDHEGFTNLQERILALRMILENIDSEGLVDDDVYNTIIVQITSLEQLMDKYKDLWNNWECYKTALEASQAPDLMLVVDKWEQLQYVTRAYFSKFWKNQLPMDEFEKSLHNLQQMAMDKLPEAVDEDVIEEHVIQRAESRPKNRSQMGQVDLTIALGAEPTTIQEEFGQISYSEQPQAAMLEQPAPKLRTAHVSMQNALGTPDSITEDSGWNDSRTVESRISVHGNRQQAPQMRMAEVKIQNASAPEQVVEESVTEDSGWNDSRTVDSRITVQGERQQAPKMRMAQVNINSALGVPETVVQDSGWSDSRTVDSRISVEGERPMRRARAGRVDMMDALGGGSGSGGSGEMRMASATVNYAQPMNGTLHAGAEMFDEGMEEEGVFENRAVYEALRAAHSKEEGENFGFATETRTAETEQLENIEVDEKKLFIIRSVVDPATNQDVSLQHAILQGIIRPQEGCYYNADTDEAMPIAVAMANGLIRVEFTSTRRGAERRSTIGIITVKTIREAVRPYEILDITDTSSGEKITQYEATKREILNEKHGIYVDKKNNQRMLISEAIDKHLIAVEYVGEAPPAQIICKTYAVRAVVDRRRKATVTFAEAVRRGIIDKETGAFRDTLNGDSMYVGDAIARGFLKARQIDNPTSMDIDPENKMLIDKTETIRKKLLRPLSVISAFKNAAKSAEMKRRSRSSASSTGSYGSQSSP